ncbi:MAG: DUF6737 family protein [Cyanobium sp.]
MNQDSASSREGQNQRGPRSIWDLKPWWCQPWSIILTGVLGLLGSWVLLHRPWITVALALLVSGWWALFLVIVPSQWRHFQQVTDLEKIQSDQIGENSVRKA